MTRERRQFGLLHRDFLFRMVDLELLSSHGDIQKLLGQFIALLGAFSFVLAVLLIPRYATSRLPVPELAVAAWGDEEFLISTTMAMAGIFAVIAWNAVLPDRRDALVLGPLPVRVRTVFAAKATAMLTGIGITVAAINVFTGISFPWFLGGPRAVAAYWATMAAAGVFVFCAFLAVQGVAAQVLSYRLFLRASSVLQLVAFFAVLSFFFLTPPLAPLRRLTAPENQAILVWLPSFWFLGLFQELCGHAHPVFGGLAARAVRNFSWAVATAAATYALTYFRHLRRVVEQPDIAPADRSRPWARLGGLAARLLAPLDCALFLFTARTIARSRQHRFLLAAFGGLGLAVSFAYAKDLIYGRPRLQWNHVTLEGLSVSLVLLAFSIVGVRAIFSLPVALKANWIFRITAVQPPAAYFSAVRKALLCLAAGPIWTAAGIYYFAIWPRRLALAHLAVLAVAGLLLADFSLYQFRKIPFACSYLPGAANLKVKLGIYVGGFMMIISGGTALEFAALHHAGSFAVFLAALVALAAWAWRRRREFAASPEAGLQFEDVPPAEVVTLDLSGEPAFVDSTYPLPGL